MGPKYNLQTCCRDFRGIQKYVGHDVCLSKGRKSGNLTQQMAQSRLAMAVKRRRRGRPFLHYQSKAPYGSQIHQCANMLHQIQRHPKVGRTRLSFKRLEVRKSDPGGSKAFHGGPKYNAATSIEELGCTKTYRSSKRALKRIEVPNLAQAVTHWSSTHKLELFVAVKGRKRPNIPSHIILKCYSWVPNPKYNAATSIEELGYTKTYRLCSSPGINLYQLSLIAH